MGRLGVFAVALHTTAHVAPTSGAFRDGIAALVARDVAPHLARGTPNLVAFPEHTGLLAAFTGAAGEAARERLAAGAPALEALTALAFGYGDELGRCAARFPDVGSPGQLLGLALTGTVVPVLLETFGGLAAAHGAWVSVGAALPEWTRSAGPGGSVYEAAGPHVRNRNLVFAPDGSLAAVQDKAYLVPLERDRGAGLGLAPAGLGDVGVVELGCGRLATVISKDAWMPDVNERLEQLGAQVLVQPEAYDRWCRPGEDDGLGDLWPPDKLQRGGWWMVQQHRGFRANVTPTLNGALGDLSFDGQPLVAVPAPDGVAGLGLAGQPPDAGWAAVGGWDGFADAAPLADERRRPELAAAAGAGGFFEGAVWADVALPDAPPEVAAPRSVAGPPSVPVPDGGAGAVDLLPHLAAAGAGVWAVWVRCGGGHTQAVLAARWDGAAWADAEPVAAPPGGPQLGRQWRPRVAVRQGVPLVAYLDFGAESWDLRSAEREPGGWADAGRVDDADRRAGVLRERGHSAPQLVPDVDGMVAVWSDLRWPWVLPQVRLARSGDGRTWSASRRADARALAGQADPLAPRSRHETRGQAAPAAAVTPAGLLVAWQELDVRDTPAVWLARPAPAPPVKLSGGLPAYRPALAAVGERVWLVWEEERPAGGGGLVSRTSRDGGRTWFAARPVDPSCPPGATQRAAALCPLGAERAAVVFEDHRAGAGHVAAVLLDGAATATRLDDAPAGAEARAPAAVLADGRVVVAWQDTRGGREGVRLRAVDEAGLG